MPLAKTKPRLAGSAVCQNEPSEWQCALPKRTQRSSGDDRPGALCQNEANGHRYGECQNEAKGHRRCRLSKRTQRVAVHFAKTNPMIADSLVCQNEPNAQRGVCQNEAKVPRPGLWISGSRPSLRFGRAPE